MGTSFRLDSALTDIGVDVVEILRRVGLAAVGSFFLCERLPVLVRCDAAAPTVARMAGVAGGGRGGCCWGVGADVVRAERAS